MAMYMSPRMRLENRKNAPKWRPLCSLPGSPTRVFSNLSSRGVHWLAVEEPVFRRPSPLLLATSSPYPFSHGTADYFYSSAVEVTPCQRELATYSPIIGLLLRYADGQRACVGEFRMDCIGETLEVDASHRLHLGFARAKKIPPHVSKLELCHPQDGGSLRWLSVPWTGKLEWWFTYGHCKVHHGGQESPSLFSPVGG